MNEEEKNIDLRVLNEEEIEERLKDLSGWEYNNNKISKEFKFPAFMDVINLINKLAFFCEKIDHHPDMHIFYKRVVFELTRYSVGGKVTERDFVVAREIERLFKKG